MRVTALVVAGGSGSRMGRDKNKVFLPLGGRTVIENTLDLFFFSALVENIVIVTRKEDIQECKGLFTNAPKPVIITEGGATRQESVQNGLKCADCDIVVIHDAARPLITVDMLDESIRECEKNGAAAVGVPCVDTIKKTDGEFIEKTIDRTNMYCIQTPQTFFAEDIKRAHELAKADGFDVTDDCSVYERYVGKIKLVRGSVRNIKITYSEDLVFAEQILKIAEERNDKQ